jgi:hypothetical protein
MDTTKNVVLQVGGKVLARGSDSTDLTRIPAIYADNRPYGETGMVLGHYQERRNMWVVEFEELGTSKVYHTSELTLVGVE